MINILVTIAICSFSSLYGMKTKSFRHHYPSTLYKNYISENVIPENVQKKQKVNPEYVNIPETTIKRSAATQDIECYDYEIPPLSPQTCANDNRIATLLLSTTYCNYINWVSNVDIKADANYLFIINRENRNKASCFLNIFDEKEDCYEFTRRGVTFGNNDLYVACRNSKKQCNAVAIYNPKAQSKKMHVIPFATGVPRDNIEALDVNGHDIVVACACHNQIKNTSTTCIFNIDQNEPNRSGLFKVPYCVAYIKVSSDGNLIAVQDWAGQAAIVDTRSNEIPFCWYDTDFSIGNPNGISFNRPETFILTSRHTPDYQKTCHTLLDLRKPEEPNIYIENEAFTPCFLNDTYLLIPRVKEKCVGIFSSIQNQYVKAMGSARDDVQFGESVWNPDSKELISTLSLSRHALNVLNHKNLVIEK